MGVGQFKSQCLVEMLIILEGEKIIYVRNTSMSLLLFSGKFPLVSIKIK